MVSDLASWLPKQPLTGEACRLRVVLLTLLPVLRLLRLKGTQQCDKVLIVVSLEDDLHFSFVAPPVKTLVAPGGVVWVN